MRQLKLEYDPALPITAHRDEIIGALERHQVIVVCGATGSGKTTQLPKLCLDAGRGTSGRLIGHTQPRRIAARALADRVAAELGTNVGAEVGYQVRFNDRTGPLTRIKLMTDGILLNEFERDGNLARYDTLIIDEAHERSLNIDLLLGLIKRLLPRRPDLKVIVTSATIDPGRFADFYGGAPIIEVSGRSYPVEVRYRPLEASADDEDGDEGDGGSTGPAGGAVDASARERSLPEGIVAAVRELDRESRGMPGDALVFLPGERQIREAAEALAEAKLPGTEVLALYSRLSAREQQRIFEPHGLRRIVLATNVAETSLTVPGIRHVIDSGLARISRYSVRGKVQRLPIERISQASAEQRKGRCGRESPGICIRLYSVTDFEAREPFTPPEILRTHLASVVLRMAALGLGEPQHFDFLDPPDTRLVSDGVRLLQELEAMDAERRITPVGRQMAALPVDPRLARMLLAASRHRCLAEMLVIASFLEAQDPRERPADAAQKAAEKHALYADARSDFTTVLNLWRSWREQSAALSGSQLRKWCREHFLSFMRLREWQELHGQLARSIRELRLRPNDIPATAAELHRALLTGFLGSIGHLDERREYEGPRGIRFVIAPGTPLAAKPPRWLVAGSLIETNRLYARMVAAVDPGRIEAAGAHLLKRSHTEPQWVESRGIVGALETVTLYGLVLASGRRVNYGRIAPLDARDLFIREAIVAGHSGIGGAWLEANRRLVADIEAIETRLRRRDLLVDEQVLVDFYAARIPPHVNTTASFESWRAKAERAEPRLLYLDRTDVLSREEPSRLDELHPEEVPIGANRLPLRYRFEPGARDDGVTVLVPEILADSLDAERLAWLVPGLRLEKVVALLRALPKALRRHFVPVPEFAARALAALPDTLPPFHDWLAAVVARQTGEPMTAAQIAALPLPDHLRLNIRIIDDHGRTLTEGRELSALRRRSGRTAGANRDAGSGRNAASTATAPGKSPSEPPALLRDWSFGELPENASITRNAIRLQVHPAIEDRGDGVALVHARSPAEAESISRRGVTRLALIALAQQARLITQQVAGDRELVLLGAGLELAEPLPRAVAWRAFRDTFCPDDLPLPRTSEAFAERIDSRRASVVEDAAKLSSLVRRILGAWRDARQRLERLTSPAFAPALGEMRTQLSALLPPDFLRTTPEAWLSHLPRYLQALSRRAERIGANARRDAELQAMVAPFVAATRKLLAEATATRPRPELTELRWLVEEFRVSLYAQDLGTSRRVSARRLAEQLERAEREVRE